MTLQIGDTAPDFEADTTEGRIKLPRLDRGLVGGAVLASPRLHARVHHRARLHGQHQAGVRPPEREDHRAVGGPVDNHAKWSSDIEETQGHAPNYPMIGDADFDVSKLYGMLPADVSGDPTERTPADNQTVRNVFVDRPGQEGQADPRVSDDHRPQLRRGAAGDRLAPADGPAQGGDARSMAGGRRRDHRRLGIGRRGARDLSGRLGVAASLHQDRPAGDQLETMLHRNRSRTPCDGSSIPSCARTSSRSGWCARSSSRRTGASTSSSR